MRRPCQHHSRIDAASQACGAASRWLLTAALIVITALTASVAAARSGDTSAALATNQVIRQFSLRNSVGMATQLLQGRVVEASGKLRGAPMGAAGAFFPSNLGSVPSGFGLPQRDGNGRPMGYCAWDNSTDSDSSSYLGGASRPQQLLYAVISPGLNGSFETNCDTVELTGQAAGDDYVEVRLASEAASQQYRSAISTVSVLNSTPGQEGDIRLVLENNRMYSFVGGAWQPITSLGPFNDNSSANGAGALTYTGGTVTVAAFEAATAALSSTLSVTGASTFNGAVTATNGLTVSGGGLNVTGNTNLTGNLNVTGTFTAGTFQGNGSGLTDLNAGNINAGILGTAFGGTGVNASAASNGALLIGNGSGFSLGTLAGTVNQVIVTNTPGGIQLSLPQNIATNSAPTFGGLMLNGMLTGTGANFTGDVAVGGAFTAASGSFTGNLAARRLLLADSSGGVTNPNLVIGAGAMAGIPSGTGGNTAIGFSALAANSTGYYNNAIGVEALTSNTTGYRNQAFGYRSLYSNQSGNDNIAVGSYGLNDNISGSNNIALGYATLYSNTSGANNIGLGNSALRLNTTGDSNQAFGSFTLYNNSTGANNSAMGDNALRRNTTGSNNVALGRNAGYATSANVITNANYTGSNNTFLGAFAMPGTTTQLTYATALGSEALVTTSNTIALGRTTDAVVIGATGTATSGILQNKALQVTGNVGISGDLAIGGAFTATSFSGNGSGLTNLNAANITTGTLGVARGGTGIDASSAANGQLLIGNGSGFTLGNLTGTADQVVITNGAGNITLALPQNIATSSTPTFGGMALNGGLSGTTGSFTGTVSALRLSVSDPTGTTFHPNMVVGSDAMTAIPSGLGGNTALGISALSLNTSGHYNTAVGLNSLQYNTTGVSNTAVGDASFFQNTSGSNNVAVGRWAMSSNTTGSDNVAIGRSAGWATSDNTATNANTTGSNNTFVGAYSMPGTTTQLTFATALGSDSRITTSNTIVLGRTTDSVVIGATGTATSGILQNKALQVTGNVGISGDLTIGGAFTATSFSGNGSGLTNLNAANISTGVLPVARGGTGVGTTPTNGQLLIGNGTGYALANITGTANRITVSNGAGTINLNLPQDIATASTPTFGGMTLNGGLTGTTANFSGRVDAASFYAGGNQLLPLTATNIRNALTPSTNSIALGTSSFADLDEGTKNTSVGYSALQGVRDGTDNAVVGYRAGYTIRDGNGNTALGSLALDTIRDGNYNTALGYSADASSDGLSYATVIGANASVSSSNTIVLGRTSDTTVIGATGTANSGTLQGKKLQVTGDIGATGNIQIDGIFTGNGSGLTNLNAGNFTTGVLPVARGGTGVGTTPTNGQILIGNGTGYALGSVTGTANQVTATYSGGNIALSLPQNIGTASTPTFGGMVLNGGLTGTTANFSDSISAKRLTVLDGSGVVYGNTVIGFGVMGPAQSGNGANTAVGFYAMAANTSGDNNAAFGASALLTNTSGSRNTALGTTAMYGNTSGADNTAVGYGAMYNNSTGSTNAALGTGALFANTIGSYNSGFGNETLARTSSGLNNSALGRQAGFDNVTGSNNTFLGANSNASVDSLNYATALGSGAVIGTSNTIVLGRTTDTTVIGATGTASSGILQNKKLQVTGDVGISGALAVGGTFSATAFSGDGSALTNLNAGNISSGTLGVARGGTGVTATPTNGQLLVGNGTGYTLANITGTANRITVNNGAGTINLNLPQDIATSSTPSFGGLTLTGGLSGTTASFSNTTTLAAGTTTVAPLRFQTGTNLTTPVFGSVEFDGTSLYVTNNSGSPTRKTIAYTDSALTGNTTGSSGSVNTTADNTTNATRYITFVNAVSGTQTPSTDTSLTYNPNTNTLTAGVFSGNGASLTNLSAGNISSGTLSAQRGGTGVDGSSAANGQLLIGTGGGFALGTLTAGTGISISNASGSITITNTSGAINKTNIDSALTFGTGNLTLGTSSMSTSSVGSRNTAIGQSSMVGGASLNGTDNTALGFGALQTLTNSAANNTAVGSYALNSSINGLRNTAVGTSALRTAQNATDNTAVGYNSQYSGLGASRVTTLGTESLYNNTNQNDIVAIGYQTAYGQATPNANGFVAIGNYAMYNVRNSQGSVALGHQALRNLTDGSANVAIGINAGYATSSNNTTNANTSGANNTFIGSYAMPGTSSQLTYATALGSEAVVSTSSTVVLGRTSDNTVIGATGAAGSGTLLNKKLQVTGDIGATGNIQIDGTFTGNGSGLTNLNAGNISSGTLGVARGGTGVTTAPTNGQILIGNGTGYALANITGTANRITVTNGAGTINLNLPQDIATTSTPTFGGMVLNGGLTGTTASFSGAVSAPRLNLGANTIIGNSATLSANTSGTWNVAVGNNVLAANTTGYNNTGVGESALGSNTTGYWNTAVGRASQGYVTSGYENSALGEGSLFYNTTGNRNSALGVRALFAVTTGSANTGLGAYAGDGITTGSNNTLIGASSNVTANNLSYATALGSGSQVSTSNTVVLGRTSDNVVLGATGDNGSGNKLQVNGNAQVTGNLNLNNTSSINFANALGDKIFFWNAGGSDKYGFGLNSSNLTAFVPDSGRFSVRKGGSYNGTEVFTVDANGLVQLTTGQELRFGVLGESSDPIFFKRVNVANNRTVLQLAIGDDTESFNGSMADEFQIGRTSDAFGNGFTPVFRVAGNGDAILSGSLVATGLRPTDSAGTIIGYGARTSSAGYLVTAIGQHAMSAANNSEAVAVGQNTLFNDTGVYNVGLGNSTLGAKTSGNANTGLGHFVMVNLSTGGDNVAIGHRAGDALTSGAENTFLGTYSDSTTSSITGATALGFGSKVSTSYTVVLGRTGDTTVIGATGNDGSGNKLQVSGSVKATAFNTSSDRRLKTDIRMLGDDLLDRLGGVNAYNYRFIADPYGKMRYGVIAQEVAVLFPDAVSYDAQGLMAVDYGALGAIAAAGVGKLNVRMNAMDELVKTHGTRITTLENRVQGLDDRVGSLETWRTATNTRMDTMQKAIDLNIEKIAEHALKIATNTEKITNLEKVTGEINTRLLTAEGVLDSLNKKVNTSLAKSEDGNTLTVLTPNLVASNFSAEQVRARSAYAERLEAEIARIRELEVDNLRANTATARNVRAETVNTGSAQVYAGVGNPAFLFSAPADGHYTVNTSALDGSYATATVIVNGGVAKVVPIASEGIDLIAVGNTVKAAAAGKSIKASWIKMG